MSDEDKAFAGLGRALLAVLDADGRDTEDPVEYLRDRLREHGEFQDEIVELEQQLDVALAKERSLEQQLGLAEQGHGHAMPSAAESRDEKSRTGAGSDETAPGG